MTTRKHRERYRDLLQASTSIISMADTAQDVVNAFAEIDGSITGLKNAVSERASPPVGEMAGSFFSTKLWNSV
jgi:hypothetical protein